MSANLGMRERGRGGWASPADANRGGGGEDVAAELEGLSAKEAIETLRAKIGDVKGSGFDPEYFPGPIAEAFYWSDADVIAIQGPVGSAKTTTLNRSRLRRAAEMPRSVINGKRMYRVYYLRQTYRQLWSTTIPSFLEVYPKALNPAGWSGGRGDPAKFEISFEDEDGVIEFEAVFMAFGDDVIASMRGIQTTDIVLNEADTMVADVLTVGIGRIDRFPGAAHFEGYPPQMQGYGQIACDFNAPDEDNWTYKVFHDQAERERMAELLSQHLPEGARAIQIQFFNQPGYGQPGTENLAKLSPGYYPRQIAAMRLAGRGDMIDRLVYNKVTFLRVGDPVFKREFSRRLHVAETTIQPEPGAPLRIGLDQGFKGAAVVAQFLAPFHWVFLAELHFPDERLMAVEFGRRLAELLDSPRFTNHRVDGGWGDMAGEHGASQAADENATWNLLVGKTAGFTILPQRIGTNRIQPRLEAWRAPLEFVRSGRPGILIDPSCRFLIRGLEARYVWKDEVDASGDKRKIPDKSYTEANVIDAGSYLLLSEHRADGRSPISIPGGEGAMAPRFRGRPPEEIGGLKTGFDILNPYGGH
jgi:hypothetical protein